MSLIRRAAITLLPLLSAFTSQPASACIPLVYADAVRYHGGDLPEQIARNAPTIQIVEASARHLLTRHYTRAERFWETGYWRGRERHRDVYVFELQVVETLKGGENSDVPIRARALDLGDDPHLWDSLGAMVQLVLSEPAPENRVIDPVAVDPYSETSCDSAVALRLGARYIVLRDERGNILIPRRQDSEWRNFLPLAAETVGGPRQQITLRPPGIVEISPATDEFVARIRMALVQEHDIPEQVQQAF